MQEKRLSHYGLMTNSIYVWDVDDVLNDLTKEFIKEYYPKKAFDSLVDANIYKCLEIKESEYLSRLDDFRQKKYLDLQPNREIIDFIKERSNSLHYILTAVPHVHIQTSFDWLVKNFNSLFYGFFFAPSPRPKDEKKIITKFDHLKNLNSSCNKVYFIDDNPKNFLETSKDIKKILWPQPWNRYAYLSSESRNSLDKIFSEHLR